MTCPVLPAGTLAKYGLTQKQYEYMWKLHKGLCWICNRPPKKVRLNIDHDHVTGRVRGLLCFRCNKFLVGRHRVGLLLHKAASYVDSTFDGRKVCV